MSLGASNILSDTKGYLKTPSLIQDNEAESSSEEHNRTLSFQRSPSGTTLGLCSGKRNGSLSSQDSRTESASLSQSQTNGVFGNHIKDRVQQELQHCNDSQLLLSKCIEKNRTALEANPAKAKRPGVVETAEYSDRGDSDMDEATYSSSQEQTAAKKAESISVTYFSKTFCRLPPAYVSAKLKIGMGSPAGGSVGLPILPLPEASIGCGK